MKYTLISEIIRFLLCIWAIVLTHYFFDGLFPVRNHNKYLHIAVVLVASTAIFVVNGYWNMWLNIAAVLLIFCLLSWSLFKISLVTAIVHSIVLYICTNSIEVIIELFYRLGSAQLGIAAEELVNRTYLGMIAVKEVCVALYIMVFRSYAGKLSPKGKSKIWWPVMMVQVILSGVMFSYIYLDFPESLVLQLFICFGTFAIFIINSTLLIILVRYSDVLLRERKKMLVAKKSEVEQHSYEQLRRTNEAYKKYFYNMKAYAGAIQFMISQHRYEEVLEISQHMIGVEDIVTENSYSGNYILDAVLQDRLRLAKEQNIKFTVEITPGINLGFLCSIDIIVMFGNLLDNAVEAAQGMEDGWITMKIFKPNDNFIMVKVLNSFQHKLARKEDNFLTTKYDKDVHGMGIESIKETAAKYGGLLQVRAEHQIFTATLMLAVSGVNADNQMIGDVS